MTHFLLCIFLVSVVEIASYTRLQLEEGSFLEFGPHFLKGRACCDRSSYPIFSSLPDPTTHYHALYVVGLFMRQAPMFIRLHSLVEKKGEYPATNEITKVEFGIGSQG